MKRNVLLVSCLVLCLVFATAAQAATENEGAELTRGEFAAMLVEAGNMDSPLSSAELLVQQGIMKGYAGGELNLDRTITRLEAATLAARTLGVSDSTVLSFDGVSSIADDHWGYPFFSLLDHYGLMEGHPADVLTEEEGRAFLDKIFSTDPQAVAILEKSREAEKDIKSMRSVVNCSMNIIPRPGVEGSEEIPQIAFDMQIAQELVLPDRIHQTTTAVIEIPGEGKQELTSEMYLADNNIYQQMPDPEDPEGAKMQWFRYPDELLPELDELMNSGEVSIPAGMEDSFNYKLLGTTEVNGEEANALVCYGKVDDFEEFVEIIAGQLGGDQQLQQVLEMAVSIIDSMSFWSIQYTGCDDNLTKGSEMLFLITCADEFAGVPNPLEILQMDLEIEEISYDEDLEIELPQEAKDAPLLELPGIEDLQELEAAAE